MATSTPITSDATRALTETVVTARAPVRISFGGGGTDLGAYADQHGGFVVSAAIARYAYVSAHRPARPAFRMTSAEYRLRQRFATDALPAAAEPLALPKAALAVFAARRPDLLDMGVDLYLSSEAPPGSGLGSSSAMTVALIRALAGYLDEPLTPAMVAALACEIEIARLGMPIGRQDQYASAFGGVNAITFARDGVTVAPLRLRPAALTALNARLLLFFTGQTRHSSQILTQQRRDSASKPATVESLHRIKALAGRMRDALLAEDFDGVGALLDEGWREKKRLSPAISSGEIDVWYAQAQHAGALGGKITGAGGGGFLLLYCPPERQPYLRRAMAHLGLAELTFTFDSLGAVTLPVMSRRVAESDG